MFRATTQQKAPSAVSTYASQHLASTASLNPWSELTVECLKMSSNSTAYRPILKTLLITYVGNTDKKFQQFLIIITIIIIIS